jgi:hypothetical protein
MKYGKFRNQSYAILIPPLATDTSAINCHLDVAFARIITHIMMLSSPMYIVPSAKSLSVCVVKLSQ